MKRLVAIPIGLVGATIFLTDHADTRLAAQPRGTHAAQQNGEERQMPVLSKKCSYGEQGKDERR